MCDDVPSILRIIFAVESKMTSLKIPNVSNEQQIKRETGKKNGSQIEWFLVELKTNNRDKSNSNDIEWIVGRGNEIENEINK